MRILLDAYFDNNFGDDLFISTILERYPAAQFFVFWNKDNPDVLKKAMQYPNMVILPGDCEMRETFPFDGYIMIGGDVLADGVDYSWRIDGMRRVKEAGGFVAMLGFSLYENYGEKSRASLREMAMLADSIVTRDHASAERFRALVPEAKVIESTDMAFTGNYGEHQPGEREILGIAPRRRLYSTDEEHEHFCKAMAAVADGWLNNHAGGTVRFLALSTGEYDDRVTAADIQRFMAGKDRTEVVAHTADVPAFVDSLRDCTAMVPTRFHALVFGLIFGIPFVPVPYEVKLTQLLDEIGYCGVRIPYGEMVSGDVTAQAVADLERECIDREAAARYQSKAGCFFAGADGLIESGRKNTLENFCGIGCTRLAEHEELLELRAQVKELTAWVQSLQKERQAFEAQNMELEAIRVKQLEQLEKIFKRFPPAKLLIK